MNLDALVGSEDVREVSKIVGGVLAFGVLLTVVSGTWPPLIAVESDSMTPDLRKGDLTYVTEPGRFEGEASVRETGVVSVRSGREHGYRSFGGHGSVIVYDHPAIQSRIVHRPHFWVTEGENWYAKGDPAFMEADGCRELPNCPAPHAGFITKGDANSRYDQAYDRGPGPIRQEWILGTVRLRIPYVGWLRILIA